MSKVEIITLLVIGIMLGVAGSTIAFENINSENYNINNDKEIDYFKDNNWVSTGGVIDCPFTNEMIIIFNNDETFFKCEMLPDIINTRWSIDNKIIIDEVDIELAYKNPYYFEFINKMLIKPDEKINYNIKRAEIHYNEKSEMIKWNFIYQDKANHMISNELKTTGLHECERDGKELWFTYWENGTQRSIECVKGGLNCYYEGEGENCISKDLYDYIKNKENVN